MIMGTIPYMNKTGSGLSAGKKGDPYIMRMS